MEKDYSKHDRVAVNIAKKSDDMFQTEIAKLWNRMNKRRVELETMRDNATSDVAKMEIDIHIKAIKKRCDQLAVAYV